MNMLEHVREKEEGMQSETSPWDATKSYISL